MVSVFEGGGRGSERERGIDRHAAVMHVHQQCGNRYRGRQALFCFVFMYPPLSLVGEADVTELHMAHESTSAIRNPRLARTATYLLSPCAPSLPLIVRVAPIRNRYSCIPCLYTHDLHV